MAVGLNLALGRGARRSRGTTVIDQAMPPPHPRFLHVFSAFSIGLLANAMLPGRVGELARVAVLTRHMPRLARALGDARRHGLRAPRVRLRPGGVPRRLGARDGGDPALGVDEPRRSSSRSAARCSCSRSSSARHHQRSHARRARHRAAGRDDGAARARRHAAARPPRPLRSSFQCIGWICQLFAVWTAMKAFSIDVDLAGGRARARADEHGDDHPALAGQRRAAPGGDRDAARRLRRAVRAGVRLRPRAAGDRGVGRRSASAWSSSAARGSRSPRCGGCRRRSSARRGRRRRRDGRRGGRASAETASVPAASAASATSRRARAWRAGRTRRGSSRGSRRRCAFVSASGRNSQAERPQHFSSVSAMTVAERVPSSTSATSPNDAPGPSVPISRSPCVAFAVPDSIDEEADALRSFLRRSRRRR